MAEGFGVGVGAAVVGMGEAVEAAVGVGASVGVMAGVGAMVGVDGEGPRVTSATADGEGLAVKTGDLSGSVPLQPATTTTAITSIAVARIIVPLNES